MASKKKASKKRKKTAAKSRKKARRKAVKKRSPTKGGSPAMDFIVAALKKNKKAAYADIKTAADKKGLTIYPIMFGRAQLLLGIAKPKRKKKAGKRGPGRPRKTAVRRGRPRKVSGPLTAVQDLVTNLEEQARENARLRETLQKIAKLIDRVS